MKTVHSSVGLVFHSTAIKSLLSILSLDTFQLMPAPANESESQYISKNKLYYLSTAFSPNSRYIRNNGSALLELDAQKLDNSLKHSALNYWSRTYPKIEGLEEDTLEQEQRYLSTKPTIQSAHAYIRAIYLNIERPYPALYSQLSKIILLASKLKLPIYFFDNQKDYLLRNKAKALPIKEVEQRILNARQPNSSQSLRQGYFPESDYLALTLLFKTYPLLVKAFTQGSSLEDFAAKNGISLSSKAYKNSYYLCKYYPDDFYRRLETFAHNYKAETDERRHYVEKLISLLHKYNFKTFKTFSDDLNKMLRSMDEIDQKRRREKWNKENPVLSSVLKRLSQ